MSGPGEKRLTERVTFEFNDGDWVMGVRVSRGPEGWGIAECSFKVADDHPILVERFEAVAAAWAKVLLTGGVTALVEAHNTEDRNSRGT